MALTTVPASLSATAITLTTAAQPNITSVGTLTGLTVSGNIAGTLTTAAQTNITSVGTLTGLTTSGNISVTGQGDFSTQILVGTNNSYFSENNIRFQSAGHAYIDHNTTGQHIIFRTSNSSSLDQTVLTLSRTGNTTVHGLLYLIDGSNSSPALTFSNDNDTGILRVTTNALGIVAGGSRKFYVNATNAYFQNLTQVQIDSADFLVNGNVGVKVPSLLAFRANSNEGAIQIGKRGVIYADTGITTQIGNNTYITSANQRVAIENDHGSFYEQYQGKHYFYTTTQAETPGTLQTFTLQMMMLQNGNVGIGEPAPDRTFHAKSGANSNDGVIRIESANNNIMDMGTDGTGHFINCVNTDPFRVKFAGTEKFRIESSGDVDLINGGNLKFAAGYGISFINNTDTATGETVSSSVLDDYEEGTFNATIIAENGTITVSNSENLCTYTRIGRQVIVQGRLAVGSVSNPSGQLDIGNLPFTLYNAGENAFSGAVVVNIYNAASNFGGQVVAEMRTTGGGRILIRGNGGTTSAVHAAAANIDSGSLIGFTATYPTT